MHYRRSTAPGATYFFTVVTHQRRPVFDNQQAVTLLRAAFRKTKQRHPFEIDAFVLLPEHIHCIWTLPEGHHDYSTRWGLIKSEFTRNFPNQTPSNPRRERAIWQRRFWEHQIRDERDLRAHIDYIHYNPVKHGLVTAPIDWPYSSLHRYVRQGILPANWAADHPPQLSDTIGRE